MRTTVKLFVLAVVFAALSQVAQASNLYGTIGMKGGARLVPGGITFSNQGTDKLSVNGTGLFSGFTANTVATFTTNFTFAGIGAPGGELLFTVLNAAGTQMLKFVVTSYSILPGTGKFIFYGTLTLYNVDPITHLPTSTVGTASTSFNYSQNIPQNDFNGDMTITPEPGSLVLLGTGLAAAAGLVVRKRRSVPA